MLSTDEMGARYLVETRNTCPRWGGKQGKDYDVDEYRTLLMCNPALGWETMGARYRRGNKEKTISWRDLSLPFALAIQTSSLSSCEAHLSGVEWGDSHLLGSSGEW